MEDTNFDSTLNVAIYFEKRMLRKKILHLKVCGAHKEPVATFAVPA
jgi:hypothetical protein